MSQATDERSRFWRRKLPSWLAIGALALIVVRTLQHQPVSVQILFRYGEAREGLQSASMRFMKGDEQMRRVKFNYLTRKAGIEQRHEVRLLKGNYDILIELHYKNSIPQTLRSTWRPYNQGERVVRLKRPLIVSGEGQVMVIVAD